MHITECCNNCSDRHPACWGDCPKYQQAKAEHDKRKQDRAQAISRNSTISTTD